MVDTPLSYQQVWGDVLHELQRVRPDARIVNLETAVTTSDDWDRQKGIHYRMHPGNVALLRAAGIDVAVLGNNHVLDWGAGGLRETLTVLRDAGVRHGRSRDATGTRRRRRRCYTRLRGDCWCSRTARPAPASPSVGGRPPSVPA
ncbi:MAG: CapA family protein [Trueperaceae bacterium]|nr:CapA family protein [Trueperaceae bacterium]